MRLLFILPLSLASFALFVLSVLALTRGAYGMALLFGVLSSTTGGAARGILRAR